jgi:LDH2 family malate/lactate/ureidoglycolate dehydrogenase
MANEQNLMPIEEVNARKTPEERIASASRAGKASAKARREKADLRKMAQQVLDGTYKDKDGKEVTGKELVISGIVANLGTPKGSNWGKSIDLLVKLLGYDKSIEEIDQIKAQTALINAKVNAMTGTDDETLIKLDQVLEQIGEGDA